MNLLDPRVLRLVLVVTMAAGCSGQGVKPPPRGGGAGGTAGTGGAAGTGGEGGTGGAAGTGGGGGAPAPGPSSADASDLDRMDSGAAPDATARPDAAGDTGPSRVPPPGGRHAALIWAYGEHLPTPKPTDPMQPLDVTMKARLEAKGLIVDAIVDATSTAAMVMDKAVIVISNSVDRRKLFDAAGKPKFRDVRVPAIVMKDGVIEVMGMGTGSDGGFSTPVGQTSVSIVKPGDPLTAGLMGDVRVYTTMEGAPCPPCYLHHVQASDRIIYAFPTPAAKVIATVVGQPRQAAIFAYDSGAQMVGVAAPAKRMGFFIHRDTDYSPDGLKLFDAALDFLLAP
jgi:hypothetical protein